MILDEFTAMPDAPQSWRAISDRVMGGVSDGGLAREMVAGRAALRLTGRVSLENDGGFLQMARDLAPDGAAIDLSGHAGLELDVFGNGETYGVHLRTAEVTRPWQSYRASFVALPEWQRLRLPFAGFAAHRIEAPLDLARVRRVGLVAIGRAFTADLALARLALYR
ncbi:CIA30 family protein [Salinarimonas ramus]|uniref:NADH:ubiquinone oxidoreductase intermediate-associated protein 30 domain-containing protein n=1 Tax=Salinarimonas ramus TaxID=690164 RepID=A0A917V4E6_9HYPH|nr:CIA30 family protein [Salinarimonas ramus]GGK35315.1 hypothetical protein GCM10011322_22690 [Salinarimonas ramus]